MTASKCHVFSFARQGPSDPGLVQRNQCLELSYPSLGSRLWSVCATVAAQVTPSIAALIPTGQRSGSSRSSCGSWITEAVRTVSGVTLCTLAQADIPHTLGQVGPVGLVGTASDTVPEILSNVVDQDLLGGEYRWSEREHFGHWFWPEHLSLTIGKLDTGFYQSDVVRCIDSAPSLLSCQE